MADSDVAESKASGEALANQFEKRKSDHIRISLDERSQSKGQSGLDKVQLVHEAIPDFNFKEVSIETSFFSHKISAPFFISSMTAGHAPGEDINRKLAELSQNRQILMGVGSQRRELTDPNASTEWKNLKRQYPGALLIGNIGIAQLIETSSDKILKLLDNMQALGLFVHVNPLQEALQPEGTPNFGGAYAAIERIVKATNLPVIVKEVGMGFSSTTLKRLSDCGVYAVDVAGRGGTHWGRVEGLRSNESEMQYAASQVFKDWGHSTLQSLMNGQKIELNCKLWASGGIRDGLEVAKCLALGANMVGLAMPFLQAIVSNKDLDQVFAQLEYELNLAMFCTGSKTLKQLQSGNKYEVFGES